jgi:hypothetical protein
LAKGATPCSPIPSAALIRERSQPGDTLAVVPEGVIFNYALRMPSSTRYVDFLPPELAMFGETAMLESLRERPPRFILLVNRNVTEYGVERFGKGYAESIMAWIQAEYEPVAMFGDMDAVRTGMGMQLLQKSSGPTPTSQERPEGRSHRPSRRD